MEIYLPDELIERAREHLKKTGYSLPIDIFIEETVDSRIESHPWFTGDICVHCEECIHRKSVEDWKKKE
jgi:hypothetical protein